MGYDDYEEILFLARETKAQPAFWWKVILSLGLYLIWYRRKKYILTNRYVRIRRGVFSVYQRDIPLDRIQDVTLQCSFWGMLFNYGTLRIESASGMSGAEIMPNVARAREFQRAILDQVTAARSEHVPTATEAAREHAHGRHSH
jgi:uncharacterized membrane protein YdbT with pleckstrin-like domain